jgi:hypothetical protein
MKLLISWLLLITTPIYCYSQQEKSYCCDEPENLSLLKDYSASVSPKISPFADGRDYFLYLSESVSINNKGYKKWCVYNTVNNEIDIIDSIYLNIFNTIYFGFENDSLFVFDVDDKKYYKIIYPQKTIDYNVDDGKILAFNQILKLKLIENEFEFVVNKRNDLAYFDINRGITYIYLNSNNYSDSIEIKGNGTSQNESMIFWYSDTELLFVDGIFDEQHFDFDNRPYIYDISENRIINIKCNEKIIRFYDFIGNNVLIGLDKEPFKTAKLSKQNGEFKLEIIGTILWKDIDKVGPFYTMFELKEGSYLFKAETKTGRQDVNGFYYSKLISCD